MCIMNCDEKTLTQTQTAGICTLTWDLSVKGTKLAKSLKEDKIGLRWSLPSSKSDLVLSFVPC